MSYLVVAPVEPGTFGPQAVNVGRILRDLLARGVIKALEPPNQPTADQLGSLASSLENGTNAAVYGDSTRQVLFYLQLQQGLDNGLHGSVRESTAGLLNRLLKECDLPATTSPLPDLRVFDAFEASFNVARRSFHP